MAQPAHASGLQNQEGEGEADFYQAEAVNADLVPVEANLAAEKGDVLRALADLCVSHTPGKFIQPHVIPHFLKACLPERFRPKHEKGGGGYHRANAYQQTFGYQRNSRLQAAR